MEESQAAYVCYAAVVHRMTPGQLLSGLVLAYQNEGVATSYAMHFSDRSQRIRDAQRG